MDHMFGSLDNLSMSLAKSVKMVGIWLDPPCWDSSPNMSVFYEPSLRPLSSSSSSV